MTYHTENQSTYTVAEEDLGAVITVVASYLDAGGRMKASALPGPTR